MSKSPILALALLLPLAACSQADAGPAVTKAVCRLAGTQGNELVKGTVTFTQEGEQVRVVAEVSGLSMGKHGFHIHEVGDISCADGTCTKGHFNPTGVAHGAPDADVRHVGDMGNLDANDLGEASLNYLDPLIELNGAHSVIGRAIIVHADPDDLTSQPTGAAGARIAYGVIGIAEEAE